jgi:hypothetical protein
MEGSYISVTSMLALNCQKKSRHTKFCGVGVLVFFVLRKMIIYVKSSILLITRRKPLDVRPHGIKSGGGGSILPLLLKTDMILDTLINLFKSLFSKL